MTRIVTLEVVDFATAALAQGNRTAANRALLSAVEIDPAARDRAAADPKLTGLVR